MPLIAEQLKAHLTAELYRENDPAFVVTIREPKTQFVAALEVAWSLYEDVHVVNVRLGYLYVKREMVGWLRQAIWVQRNTRAMDRYDYASDLKKGLDSLYKDLTAQIDAAEATAQAATGEGGETGDLVTVGAIAATGTVVSGASAIGTLGGDPNNPAYRGDPLVSPLGGL